MNNNTIFKDRAEAGEKLASLLKQYKDSDAVVCALPRGGVVLGEKIAKALSLPLDLIIVRKIGHPKNPEYAIAAISEDGHLVYNEEEKALVDQKWFDKEAAHQIKEAKRRRLIYLKGRIPEKIKGKTVIIVDDGIATGLTMFAAIQKIKHQNPAKIIVAIPVAPKETLNKLKEKVDEVITIFSPEFFMGAIGSYYQKFEQVEDEEVVALMRKAL